MPRLDWIEPCLTSPPTQYRLSDISKQVKQAKQEMAAALTISTAHKQYNTHKSDMNINFSCIEKLPFIEKLRKIHHVDDNS